MLSKKNRTNKKKVDEIFQKGVFVGSANLVLKYIKENTQDIPQVAFITPKGVAKNATDRNKLRRRGYSILKKYMQYFPVGFSGVFIFGKKSVALFGGRRNNIKKPSQDLEKEVILILRRLRYLK